MYAADDTIVAVATPPGRGGLAVVRVSGPAALRIVASLMEGERALAPRRATLATLWIPGENERDTTPLRDEAVVTAFPAPSSYTGEDVVEVSLHGSPLLAARVVAAAVGRGARLARAGEFTLRAFLKGRLDLAQAEAVEDLVSATTAAQARMAYDQLQGGLSERIAGIERELFALSARLEASVDFPEEGYHFVPTADVVEALRGVEGRMAALLADGRRGRVLRDGATVAVVGRTNVGKSTVFNRLVGSDRAIVTDIPGTTRDLVSEKASIAGVPITMVDTAGTRESTDPVEREGMERARRARAAADFVLVILDGSEPLTDQDFALLEETASAPRVVVVNKTDLEQRAQLPSGVRGNAIAVAALDGRGFDTLERAIAEALTGSAEPEPAAISNVRHIAALARADEALRTAIEALQGAVGQMPEEIVLAELQDTREALEEITGRRTTDQLLEEIFSKFCVGK